MAGHHRGGSTADAKPHVNLADEVSGTYRVQHRPPFFSANAMLTDPEAAQVSSLSPS